jgi:hypothetical protein
VTTSESPVLYVFCCACLSADFLNYQTISQGVVESRSGSCSGTGGWSLCGSCEQKEWRLKRAWATTSRRIFSLANTRPDSGRCPAVSSNTPTPRYSACSTAPHHQFAPRTFRACRHPQRMRKQPTQSARACGMSAALRVVQAASGRQVMRREARWVICLDELEDATTWPWSVGRRGRRHIALAGEQGSSTAVADSGDPAG